MTMTPRSPGVSFNIFNFVRTNKVFVIWTAFFALLYLVRGFFGLVFLTFILCFVFNNLIERLARRSGNRRRFWTVVVYFIFLAIVALITAFIAPRLGAESSAAIKQVPKAIDEVREYLEKLAAAQPNFGPLIRGMKDSLDLHNLLGVDRQTVVSLAVASFNRVTHYLSYFLLGTLFSFFILLDYPNLRARLANLRNTRLQEVYEETAESVVLFARVVGEAFQAQMMIAAVNTMLTAIGLWGLGVPIVALLSTVVFFCGLIPVLGTFISSVPIILLAFNTGGMNLAMAAVAMISVVHAVEAYILNPRIYSAVFKINPVLTLIILYIGHTLFGMWGVLLGVPISVYIYRHVVLGQPKGEVSAVNVTDKGKKGGGRN
jgi:predicted PurR-regulated permease PerM